MPRLSLGLGVQTIRKVGGAAALITTSKAFNSSGVQVGNTITGSIPGYWVQSQTTVTSVIFANDNSVTSIGDYAFQSCTSLASIAIPNSVTSISSYAFSSSGLTSITIPNSVTSIGASTFYSCTSLATATIGTGVTTIFSNAFYNTGLTSVTIPSNVTSIGQGAFDACTSLTSISISNGVTGIGNEVFRNCPSLASVICRVAQSAFVGSNAFYGTASPLVIQARSTDASWTAGTGLTFQGNTNVTVIKNL